MNKRLRKLKILVIFIITILVLPTYTFATPDDDSIGGKIWGTFTDGWGYWLQEDSNMDIDIELGKSGAESSSNDVIEKLLGTFQVIGSVISVIALMIIGFRYMFSGLEEKAQMKGVIAYYIVGAVLVFATSNVLSIAYNLINGL